MIVVPFRAGGKSRLPNAVRQDLSLAMLGDVLVVATAVDDTTLVTGKEDASSRLARELGVRLVIDPGLGQGRAVAAALRGVDGPCLVVNADLPAVKPSDVARLAEPTLRGEFGVVEARDGTTNALALPTAESFAALYGAGSAARFHAHARGLALTVTVLAIPNLVDDVDTLDDLERLGERVGPRTRRLVPLAAR